MKTPVLAWVVAGLLGACSDSLDPAEAPSAGAERVFVEAALARLDDRELALVRSMDMDRVIMGNSLHVISTLGAIAELGVPLVIDRSGDGKAHTADSAQADVGLDRFEVTPAIMSGQGVRLDMKLNVSADGNQHSFTKADVFSGTQLRVWNTELKTPSGESIVLLVQPMVIENERDLKAILTRRSAGPVPATPVPATPVPAHP
jgi:hypothetical protein